MQDRISAGVSRQRLGGPAIFLECGPEGDILYPDEIKFTAPPKDSPFAKRLVLASVVKGGIAADIDLKAHRVTLSIDPQGKEKRLLIRIPIGVRLFEITDDRGKSLNQFHYEASDDYHVVPLRIPAGTDQHQGQKVEEVVLTVTPVPPRDPSKATEPLKLSRLTQKELNARDRQNVQP